MLVRARVGASAVGTLIVGLTAFAAHQAAAGEDGVAATTVKATEVEWSIKASPARAKPGKVTFVVRNAGKLAHEFVVLKTNIAPGKLPVKSGKAAEPGRVGKIPEFKPGATKRITLTLKAGKHVLICNIRAHYKAGQFGAFSVG